MSYLLEDLVIDRVDLVDEGANSASFIELFKRKEQKEVMDYKEIIAKMDAEHGKIVQEELSKLSESLQAAQAALEAEQLAGSAKEEQLTEASEKLKATEEELSLAKEALATSDKANKSSFDESELIKSLPEEAKAILTKARLQKEAAEEELRKAKDAEKHSAAVAKAATLKSLPIEQDKLVELVKSAAPEVVELLSTVACAMDETLLGNGIGKSKAGTGAGAASTSGEAWARIESTAEEVAKKENISKAKAISKVVNDNPDLYKQYLQGGAN